MAENDIVARKHWIVYFKCLLWYAFWLTLLLAIAAFLFMYASVGTYVPAYKTTAMVAGVIVLLVFLFSVWCAIETWMANKSISWTATEEGLVVRGGWLPWNKRNFTYPYDTIFEAYLTFGFFAKLYGYRNLSFRRTEGVTSKVYEGWMTDNGITKRINDKIKELRALQHVAPAPAMISEGSNGNGAKSQAEQLRELASLKAEGTITAEEFDLMKRKIVMS